MATSDCRYFDSAAWRDRLRYHVGRTWDLEMAIDRTAPDRDVEAVLDGLADSTELDLNRPHELSLREVIDRDDGAVLSFGIDDAVDAWRSERDTALPTACPHEVVEGDLCPFHQLPSSTEVDDIADRFLTAIQSEGPDDNQFVGARIDTLDLSQRQIGSREAYPIDLRFAEIGRLNLASATVGPPLRGTGIVVSEPIFERTTFTEAAIFDGSVFGSKSEGDVSGDGRADLEFADNFAEFGGEITFRRAAFEEKADFKRAAFGGNTSFNTADFCDIAMFNYASVEGGFDLMHARFQEKADFSKATIGGYAVFNATYEGNLMLNYTRFEGEADFWNATFEGMVDLWATTFRDAVDFQYTTFEGFTSIKEASFEKRCDFTGARFRSPVEFDRVTAAQEVRLVDADIPEGRIVQPRNERTYYDCTNTRVGDLRLSTADGSPARLDTVRFVETNFDGFDFARHRASLRPDWTIHTYGRTDDRPSYDRLESTYLRAKNGASAVGDGKGASEFFLREMRNRRKENWRQLRAGTDLGGRVRAGGRWATNWFYNLTCGYGERPLRTAVAAAGFVFAFAVVYAAIGLRFQGEGVLPYLTFSLQTFVTLIFGGVPDVEPVLHRLIAAFEAFMGAFFIALFVFSLTRSIHR